MKQKNLILVLTLLISMVSLNAIADNITFADSNVKAICVEHWDRNGDGEISFDEAASVTALRDPFKGNTSITSFDELAYFTGLKFIYSNAFNGCSGLTSITIPQSVMLINNSAFKGCSGLSSIKVSKGNGYFDSRDNCNAIIETSSNKLIVGCKNTFIPNSVTSIGDYAFEGSGITSITIPNSVTSIGKSTFSNSNKLTSITISNSVTKIDKSTFEGCSGLTSVTIPNSVTSIGSYAFDGCSGLTSITIPNSVTSIGDYAFRNCYKLNKVIINDIGAWCNIVFSGSYSNPIEFARHLYSDENTEITDLVIPNGVTTIGKNLFANCEGLTSITIPNSVTSIGNYSFDGCSGLISITIPNSVTSIGDNAFQGCNGLTSVTIPNSLTSIGDNAFKGCSGLTSITIPNSVTSIGKNAFYCISLISVTALSPSPATITQSVFLNCANATLYVPAGCKAAYEVANEWKEFKEIVELADYNFTFADSNVKTICIEHWDTDGDGLISFDEAAAVTTLSDYFRNKSITLFDELINFTGLTSIDSYAFDGCSVLTSIAIPSSVTSIGSSAFNGCSGLTSITIPSSVTSIGSSAFSGCSGLSSVTVMNPSPFAITENVFSNRTKATLYVPAGSKAAYEAASYWKDFKEIVEPTITFADSNVKAICVAHWDANNDGEINFDEAAAVTTLSDIFKENTSITSFDELAYFTGLTRIDDYAFSYCDGLTSVTIPNSVKSIGDEAFYSCDNLTSVTISNGVMSIGEGAFYECFNLNKVIINDIGAWCNVVFSGSGSNPLERAHHLYSDENTEITDLVIPNGVTTIRNEVFSYCDGLASVTIPNSVTSIGDYAFFNCSGLTSITIPSSIKSIGYEAFEYCDNLIKVIINDIAAWCNIAFSESNSNPLEKAHHLYSDENTEITDLVIPNGVTIIGDGLFGGCEGLTSVTIPNSVTSIGYGVFWGCSGLTSVTIPSSIKSIGNDAFYDCCDLNKIIINDIGAWCGIAFLNCDSNPLYYAHHLYSDENTEITDLVIPNGVTTIGNYAFAGSEGFTSVTIPSSVTSIGENAFAGCSGLNSVSIPNSVTSIDENAFSGCSGLTSIVVESDNSKYDSRENCNAIIETVANKLIAGCKNTIIPNSVTSIDDYAFYRCDGLTSITIPNNLTSIGDYAFSGCSGLTSVTVLNPLPVDITKDVFTNRANATLYVPTIGSRAAYEVADYWKEFKTIKGNEPYAILSDNNTVLTFYYNYQKEARDGMDVGPFIGYPDYQNWYAQKESIAKVVFDDSFANYTSLTSTAFWFLGCNNLATVTGIENLNTENVTDMSCMFSDCSGLANLDLSGFKTGNVSSMSEMFYGCSALTNLDLSGFKTDNVTSMSGMFSGCSGLTNLDLSGFNTEKVTDMTRIFYGCFGLTSITIPNSVASIGVQAFQNCNSLTSITIPNSVTSIGSYAFDGCSGLTSINIPNSVTSIGEWVFSSCSGLTSIVVESENTKYDSRENCNAIIETETNKLIVGCKNTIIPNTIKSIGNGAFEYCSGLTSVNIPSSVTSIGDYVFTGCSNLTSVTVLSPTPVAITENVFPNCANAALYVPVGSKAAYKAADYWKKFKEIEEKFILFADDNVKAICVKHWDTDHDGEICLAEAATVTTLSTYFTYNASIASFNELAYFTNVTSIGNSAFYGCISLTSITIPNSVTSIGDYAFSNSGLASVTIPNSVTSIGNGTFEYCEGLTSITIPNSVTSIGDYAFYDCCGFTSIIIPNSVTSIGNGAFSLCRSLIFITIPNSVTSIANSAFSDCSGLKWVRLLRSESVTMLYTNSTFNNCSSLKYIIVPEGAGYETAAYWSNYAEKIRADKVTLFAGNATNTLMSWCGQLAYTKPEGCTVYTIGNMTDNQVNLTIIDGDVIPAYKPVIIQRTEGSLNAPIKAKLKYVDYGNDLATTTVAGAKMYGNTTETVVNTGGYYTKGKSYALYGDKFLLVDTDEGLSAHRCMLTLSSPAATRSLGIGGIEDGAISIDNGQLANDNCDDGVWYDLQGRKLDSKPTRKGLYIFNGKKMVIK